MSFRLNEVVCWGRSFDEYVRMFSLTEADLNLRIVACADGPAAFNAAMHRRGRRVVSCDPIYAFTAAELDAQIAANFETVMAQTRANAGNFVWGSGIDSPEELGRVRMAAMQEFLADFEEGRRNGRYMAESLPTLSFADGAFDLALCSHFLFLYSEQLSAAFHLAAVAEMCRVAREVRIFPLLDLDLNRSRHVGLVADELPGKGYNVEVVKVAYEFQRGGDEMMRISATG